MIVVLKSSRALRVVDDVSENTLNVLQHSTTNVSMLVWEASIQGLPLHYLGRLWISHFSF